MRPILLCAVLLLLGCSASRPAGVWISKGPLLASAPRLRLELKDSGEFTLVASGRTAETINGTYRIVEQGELKLIEFRATGPQPKLFGESKSTCEWKRKDDDMILMGGFAGEQGLTLVPDRGDAP